jgi:hypothetical protein
MVSTPLSRDRAESGAGIRQYPHELARSTRSGSIGKPSSPRAQRAVAIEIWEDLLNVSDTLGKPILRYVLPGPSKVRLYYVRDGLVNYVYSDPPPERRAPKQGTLRSPGAGPPSAQGDLTQGGWGDFASGPSMPPGAARIRANLGWPVSRGPRFASGEPKLLAEARSMVQNLRQVSLPPEALSLAIPHLRWAVASIRAGRLNVASHELLLARRALNQ